MQAEELTDPVGSERGIESDQHSRFEDVYKSGRIWSPRAESTLLRVGSVRNGPRAGVQRLGTVPSGRSHSPSVRGTPRSHALRTMRPSRRHTAARAAWISVGSHSSMERKRLRKASRLAGGFGDRVLLNDARRMAAQSPMLRHGSKTASVATLESRRLSSDTSTSGISRRVTRVYRTALGGSAPILFATMPRVTSGKCGVLQSAATLTGRVTTGLKKKERLRRPASCFPRCYEQRWTSGGQRFSRPTEGDRQASRSATQGISGCGKR